MDDDEFLRTSRTCPKCPRCPTIDIVWAGSGCSRRLCQKATAEPYSRSESKPIHSTIRWATRRFAMPYYLVQASAANGLRTASAAARQRLSIGCSPTTSRSAATAATHTIRTTACACADRITPSRPSASARADWPRRPEGEGVKFLSPQPPPTARVLSRGFFSHG
jgi:hypothetical protein